MDVVCFSFDCTFNDDGSSNCNTTDPKYSKTTTSTPTTQPAPLPTRPTSHQTSTPTTQPAPLPTRPTSHPTSTPTTQPAPLPTHPTSHPTSTQTTSVPKSAPSKPSTAPISTGRPTSSHPSSQKPIVTTTPISSRSTLTLTHIVTTPLGVTTTANNSRLTYPPLPHKVTSHPPINSAGGKSIYIPCSVVGFVVVFLFVSIGITRRHRNRRGRSNDRQPLKSEAECYLTFEDPPFQFNAQTSYVQPITGHGDPRFSIDDNSDKEDNDAKRLGFRDFSSNDSDHLIHFSSGDSDDLETSPKVDVDEVIFDASTVRQKKQMHCGNNSGVV